MRPRSRDGNCRTRCTRRLFERLSSNELVNLAKLEEEVRGSLGNVESIGDVSVGAWRDVAASVIGQMGRVDGKGTVGVHVEVFSKDYIIPPVNAARWPKVEEDVTPEPQGTQAYFSAQHAAIMVKDKLRAAAQRGKKSQQSTPTTENWQSFCTENHRLLSRVIGFHRNQWLIGLEAGRGRGAEVRRHARCAQEHPRAGDPRAELRGAGDRRARGGVVPLLSSAAPRRVAYHRHGRLRTRPERGNEGRAAVRAQDRRRGARARAAVRERGAVSAASRAG